MDPKKLSRWLKNPRTLKKVARMPPLDLSEKEVKELIQTLE